MNASERHELRPGSWLAFESALHAPPRGVAVVVERSHPLLAAQLRHGAGAGARARLIASNPPYGDRPTAGGQTGVVPGEDRSGTRSHQTGLSAGQQPAIYYRVPGSLAAPRSDTPLRQDRAPPRWQLVLYPINLPRATPEELRGLLGRLRAFGTDVEARLA